MRGLLCLLLLTSSLQAAGVVSIERPRRFSFAPGYYVFITEDDVFSRDQRLFELQIRGSRCRLIEITPGNPVEMLGEQTLDGMTFTYEAWCELCDKIEFRAWVEAEDKLRGEYWVSAEQVVPGGFTLTRLPDSTRP